MCLFWLSSVRQEAVTVRRDLCLAPADCLLRATAQHSPQTVFNGSAEMACGHRTLRYL